MQKLLSVIAVAALSLASINIARADSTPAPDFRGDPHSTYTLAQQPVIPPSDEVIAQPIALTFEITDFQTVGGTYPLYNGDFGAGPGQPYLQVIEGVNANHDEQVQAQQVGGTQYNLWVPNYIDPLPIKYWWLQLYLVPTTEPISLQTLFEPVDPTGLKGGDYNVVTDPSNPFYVRIEGYFTPNPDWEFVSVYVEGTTLNELVFDTVSVPEPGVMSLLFTGALVLIARRPARRCVCDV